MVRVRYTGGSLYSRRDGPTWTPEDDVHDVDAGLAEELVRRARFERVDPSEGLEPEDTAEGESENPDTEGGETEEPEAQGESDDGTCAGTTADGSPCENAAGEDGYCHIASHGPEG